MKLIEMQTINMDSKEFVQPLIYTERLILRPLSKIDAPVVHFLANENLIAANVFNDPFPHTETLAKQWIKSTLENFQLGRAVVFGIAENNNGNLLGTIGLDFDKKNNSAQMSYWIAKDYWGHRYCTEAAQNIAQYAFDVLGLEKIYSCHCVDNPAAAKVFNNIGMTYRGVRENYIRKGARMIDVYFYTLAKEDFNNTAQLPN